MSRIVPTKLRREQLRVNAIDQTIYVFLRHLDPDALEDVFFPALWYQKLLLETNDPFHLFAMWDTISLQPHG
jgi:hypothetical protein